ncbi:MAG: transposase [Candidatus Hydrogenedentes bacterium]|nr:transposase [Candidatus Hydrogenedentota bacterium]
MARTILPDELWTIIELLLPPIKPSKTRGRSLVPNHMAFTGMLFVPRTDIQSELLSEELGCKWRMTCWRRLALWQALGVWQRVHEALLAKRHCTDQIDGDRTIADPSSVRAVLERTRLARTPPIGLNPAPSTT